MTIRGPIPSVQVSDGHVGISMKPQGVAVTHVCSSGCAPLGHLHMCPLKVSTQAEELPECQQPWVSVLHSFI
jgi:hypothetical protein